MQIYLLISSSIFDIHRFRSFLNQRYSFSVMWVISPQP